MRIYEDIEPCNCCTSDLSKEGIWVTRDGTRIKYQDLEDSHLINIMSMLGPKHPGVPPLLTEEYNRRFNNV